MYGEGIVCEERMPENGEPAPKRLWQSAAGLSAIAAVVTAAVSAGALAVNAIGTSDPVTPPIAASSSPSAMASGPTTSAVPSDTVGAERAVYEDSLADRSVGWVQLDGPDCFSRFARAGLRLLVDATPSSFCSVQAAFSPELVTLESVRIEVDAEWVRLTGLEGDGGRGAVGLRCRGHGLVSSGRFYTASIADDGSWSIDRWEGAQVSTDRGIRNSTVLASGSFPSRWGVGDTVHLALECAESDDGLIVALSVDGEPVGAGADPEPLPPGDAGLVAFQLRGPVEVEFRRLSVVELIGEGSS